MTAIAKTLQILLAHGCPDAQAVIDDLQAAGILLGDRQAGDMLCRWVPVDQRAVPADADTIIRTITRSNDAGSISRTAWLDGLQAPRLF
jgi:hypothetical protein